MESMVVQWQADLVNTKDVIGNLKLTRYEIQDIQSHLILQKWS